MSAPSLSFQAGNARPAHARWLSDNPKLAAHADSRLVGQWPRGALFRIREMRSAPSAVGRLRYTRQRRSSAARSVAYSDYRDGEESPSADNRSAHEGARPLQRAAMYFACSVSVSGDLLDCDAEISDCPQQDTSNPLMVELRGPFVAKKLRLLEHE